LVAAVRAAKQFLTYVNGAPFQHAIAAGLDACDDDIAAATSILREKRDFLAAGLDAAGFDVLDSQGTFFLTTDISALTDEDPYEFCRSLPRRCGLVAIPSTVFYDDVTRGAHHVRWMFSKRHEVLEEAVGRLARLRA
jgi:N-succinyldiaminopimelate aminotransferase